MLFMQSAHVAIDPRLSGYVLIALGIIYVGALWSLARMGWAAFRSTQAAAPRAFGLLFERAVPLITVALVVLAVIILAMLDRLTDGPIGVLGSIAAYVLGSATKTKKPKPTAPKNDPE